jgi:hypothetical protein
MTEWNREDIERLVREILAEIDPGRKDAPPKREVAPRSESGTRVLFLFNAGVRRLDEALVQVDRIDASVAKSGVYTGPSARQWVCGADVRGKTSARCILDTVTPEGVEKVLERADVLVLPTLCLIVASKVARFICDDQESRLIFTALLQDKKVIAARDGFMVYEILKNEKIGREIDHTVSKLESYGVLFCETHELYDTFREAALPKKEQGNTASVRSDSGTKGSSMRLITAKAIYDAFNNNINTLKLSDNGKITPLAADLAKEYKIQIKK